MSKDNNIPQADHFWPSAEKMIDKHFRKRKIMLWFFSFAIPAVIIGLSILVRHQMKSSEDRLPGNAISEIEMVSKQQHSKLSLQNIRKLDGNNVSEKVTRDAAPIAVSQNNVVANVKMKSPDKKFKNHQTVFAKKIASPIQENKATDSKIEEKHYPGNESEARFDNEKYSPVNFENPESPRHADLASIHLLLPLKSKEVYSPDKSAIHQSLNLPHADHFISSKIGWEASIYGGAAFIGKNISVDGDWKNYLQHRRNEEDGIIAPSFGASLSANMNSFSLSIGAEYSVYGERTNYFPYSNQETIINSGNWNTFLVTYVDTDTAYVLGSQYVLNTILQRTDSIFDIVSDTVQEYRYDKRIAESNGVNRIFYIEVPLEVSFYLTRGKAGFGLSGGISPGWMIHETGNYIRADETGVESFSEIKSFRKFMLNARVSTDFFYRAGPRTKLVLRPQFRTNLNSIFDQDYGVNQRYYSTGILFGISYLLN